MLSILRQIVAGPRQPHPEANLDLCYVTDNVIATSGPSGTYPKRAYRNPLDELVKYLDTKHGPNWCIWEFRAEGTGYPDSEVYGRIHHFPWPDHHPPPFALIPNIMASMRNWLHHLDKDIDEKEESGKRVAVVHCKAGKGRSGTVACAYLISQEGWKKEEALQQFTGQRMRPGFGEGVSIPSQLRYVGYIDRWANHMAKQYVERPVEILEVHLWGLRDGVKVAVEGYVDQGKKIKCFHLFDQDERTIVEDGKTEKNQVQSSENPTVSSSATWSPMPLQSDVSLPRSSTFTLGTVPAMILRPDRPILVTSSDVNIDFERRSKVSYTGFTVITSIAHVWFNAYFEGGEENDSGVFETEWDAMDGIKGSAKRGIRALDKLKVVWRYPSESQVKDKGKGTPAEGRPVSEPKPGDPIHESQPSDWRGLSKESQENLRPSQRPQDSTASLPRKSKELWLGLEKELELQKQTDDSKDVGLTGGSDDETKTMADDERVKSQVKNDGLEGVTTHGLQVQDAVEPSGK